MVVKTQFMNFEVRGLKRRIKALGEALMFINKNYGEGAIANVVIHKMTPTRMSGHVIRHIPRSKEIVDTERLNFRTANGHLHFIGKNCIMVGGTK
jgi:hypothetical protein